MQVDLPLNLRLGAIALFWIGPAALLITSLGALNAWNKQSWPAATAQVVKTDIETTKKPVVFSLKGRTNYADYFTARCAYTYEVDGQQFTQNRICAEAFDRTAVERQAQPYSAGNQITIFYSPRRPDNSILTKKADIAGLALGFGLGSLAIPLGFVLRRVARNMSPHLAASDVPSAAAGGFNPFDSKPAPLPEPQTPRPSLQTQKWSVLKLLLRGSAVSAGLVFVLLGGLCLAVSLAQFAKAPNPARAEVDMAVRIVATAIFACVPLFGAFLIWLGLRRPRSASRPAEAINTPSQVSTNLGLSPFHPSSITR